MFSQATLTLTLNRPRALWDTLILKLTRVHLREVSERGKETFVFPPPQTSP